MNFHLQFNSLFPHTQFHVDRCPLSECIRESVFACPKNGILILIVYSDHLYTSVIYRWGILLAVCAIVFKFTPPPVLGTGNDTSPEWWPVTEGVSVVDLLLFFFSTVIQVNFNAYSMIAVLFNDMETYVQRFHQNN